MREECSPFLERHDAAELLRDEEPSFGGQILASDLASTQAGSFESAMGSRATEEGIQFDNETIQEDTFTPKRSGFNVAAQEYDAAPVYTINTGHDPASSLAYIDTQDQVWVHAVDEIKEVGTKTAANRFGTHVKGSVGDQARAVAGAREDLSDSDEPEEELTEQAQSKTERLFEQAQRHLTTNAERHAATSSVGASTTTGSAASAGTAGAAASSSVATSKTAIKAAAKMRYASAASVRLAGSGTAIKSTASGIAKGIGSGGASAAAAAASPWVAIALGVVALLTLILVSAVGCITIFGAMDDDSTGSLTGNQAIVASYLLGKGLDQTHVAAIMGNMHAENASFDPATEETPWANSGDGYGLCQWTGSRRIQLMSFASSKGELMSDIQIQLDFLWAEITGEGDAATYSNMQVDFEGFLALSDLEECVMFFGRNFERPLEATARWDERVEAARDFLAAMMSNSSALIWAISVAEDDTIGYSWGCARPGEYDCQGFVKAALQQAGENVSWSYTGDMAAGLIAAGYTEYTYTGEAALQPEDILLYHISSGSNYSGHAAFWVGGGNIVEAINDFDGVAGDSNGREIRVSSNWADGTWQNYYRKAA